MKIIEILNTIARGEEPPKKIKVFDEIFEYSYDKKDYEHDYEDGSMYWLFDDYEWKNELNTEVEILEITIHNKKKIEKLEAKELAGRDKWELVDIITDKVNEIIDKVNDL